MRRAGTGSIINISSRSGLVGIPAAAAYASSKAAVRNHTKSVALYCAEQGIAHSLQLDSPSRDLDADVGAVARHRSRARGTTARIRA
jgi:hypothetical protein